MGGTNGYFVAEPSWCHRGRLGPHSHPHGSSRGRLCKPRICNYTKPCHYPWVGAALPPQYRQGFRGPLGQGGPEECEDAPGESAVQGPLPALPGVLCSPLGAGIAPPTFGRHLSDGEGTPRPAGMATPAWLWEEGPAAAHSGVLLEELLRPPPPSLGGEAGTTRTPVQPSNPRQHLLQLGPPGIPTLSLWGLVETSDAWYPQCHFSWRPRCGSGWGAGMDLGVAARVKVPGLGPGGPRAVQVASLSSPGKMSCSWLCPAHPWNSFSNLDLPGAGEAGLEHHPLMGCLFARSQEFWSRAGLGS